MAEKNFTEKTISRTLQNMKEKEAKLGSKTEKHAYRSFVIHKEMVQGKTREEAQVNYLTLQVHRMTCVYVSLYLKNNYYKYIIMY